MAKKKINKSLILQGLGQIGLGFAEGIKVNSAGAAGKPVSMPKDPLTKSKYNPGRISDLNKQFKPFG